MDKHMVYIMYLKHARSKRKEKQGGRPLDARMVSVAQQSWEREKPAVRCGGSGFKQEAPVKDGSLQPITAVVKHTAKLEKVPALHVPFPLWEAY